MTKPVATLDHEVLTTISGGMRWENLPMSKNVEDRRPKWAIERDDKWFRGLR